MRQKILLIDDSEAVHQLVRASLAEEPVTIGSAYDGNVGFELAVRMPPDLILLDVDMPGADGFEVCRQLHEDLRTANVPVVFLTAAGSSQQKVHGLDAGGSDYITKPFDPSEFAARVRAALRAKMAHDALRSTRVAEFIGRVQTAAG